MRLLHIGDVVGNPGRKIINQLLAKIRLELHLDMVTINAENATNGSGLSPAHYQELISAGADCITMGDHVYRRREIYSVLEKESKIVRPANLPTEAPGKSYTLVQLSLGVRAAIINLLGRVFMPIPVDCPFHAADKILRQLPPDVKVILVDMHAEATSDKQIMGRYLDGRVTAVLGTHTHVATADEMILPKGTAFQCDVGMTGAMNSILGRKIERVTETVITARPTIYEIAEENLKIHGTVVDFHPHSGRATGIQRVVYSM